MSKHISLNTNSISTTLDTINKKDFYHSTNSSTISNTNNKNKLFLKTNTLNPNAMTISTEARTLRLGMIKENIKRQGSKSQRNSINSLSGLNENSFVKATATTKSFHRNKLTIPMINDEIKKIHLFIENSPCGFDENILKNTLMIKQSKYSKTIVNSFSNNNQSINRKKKLSINNEEDPKYQQFLNTLNNPSYSMRGIKKAFPEYTKNKKFKLTPTFGYKYNSKTLRTTMLAVKKNNHMDSFRRYDVKKNKLTQASRLKLKCNTIKWFIDNKKELLNRLVDKNFQEQILKISDKKTREFNAGLTIEEFGSLMQRNKITNDPEIIKKLFWIFDEDGDNDLKYSEIASGIEMFRDSTPEEKVKVLFRLCDTDHSNSVSKKEFYTMLKRNIINKDDIAPLKKSIEKIFNLYGGDVELSLEQLTEGFKANKELEIIINKNMVTLKTIDSGIDNEVKKDLLKFTADQNLFLKQKLYGGNCETCPILDKKFGRMVEGFVDKKEKIIKLNQKKEDSFDFDSEEQIKDDDIFQEEKAIYNMVTNMSKKED